MRTVRARLTGFTILIVAVLLVTLGLTVRLRVQLNLTTEVREQLANDISGVSSGAPTGTIIRGLPPPPGGVMAHDAAFGGQARMVQVVQSGSGAVSLERSVDMPRLIPIRDGKADDALNPAQDPEGIRIAAHGVRAYREFHKRGEPMLSYSVPVSAGGRIAAVAQAVRTLRPMRAQMVDLDRALIMSIPIAIILSAIGGTFLVGSILRPLRRLTEAANKLDDDLSGTRLPATGDDEFAALARAFNDAFDRTSAAFASQAKALAQLERFTGDAGHELRTPLGAIKGSASYLVHMTALPEDSKSAAQIIDRSADRMAKLIDDLLLLARQDGGRMPVRRTKVEVGNLIHELYECLERPDKIQVELPPAPGPVVNADRFAIERVLTNLLTNAFAYARSRVVVSASVEEGLLTISVEDDGEGIAPEHLPRLGERFYRPDESRSRAGGGVGLGLAIVRSLCEANDGRLEIDSRLGRGTIVRTSFRTASQSSPGQ